MTFQEEIDLMNNEDRLYYEKQKKIEEIEKINKQNDNIEMYKSYIVDYIKIDGIFGKNNMK